MTVIFRRVGLVFGALALVATAPQSGVRRLRRSMQVGARYRF